MLSVLQPSSPGERKPFRCNVCNIGYGQGATLDIHLRSVNVFPRIAKILGWIGFEPRTVGAARSALALRHSDVLCGVEGVGAVAPEQSLVRIRRDQNCFAILKFDKMAFCRSVAHQSRMTKLSDLVASGEIDASKAVLEQPGGPTQKLIRELVAKEEEVWFHVNLGILLTSNFLPTLD